MSGVLYNSMQQPAIVSVGLLFRGLYLNLMQAYHFVS